MILEKIKASLNYLSFEHSTLKLMMGSILAQLLPVLISPLLTRMYTVEAFGLFALFLGVSNLVSSLMSGKYELAVMVSKDDKELYALTCLSILISACMGLVLTILFLWILLFFPKFYVLSLVPLLAMLIAVNQSLYNFHNKLEHYNRLTFSLMFQAMMVAGLSLVFAFFGQWPLFHNYGLIIAMILSQFLALIILSKSFFCFDERPYLSWSLLRQMARNYYYFPLYTFPTELIQRLVVQFPVLFLSIFFSQTALGLYGLAYRIAVAPVSIISRSFGNVFFQKASEKYHKNKNCSALFVRFSLQLSIIAVIIFVGFAWIIPPYLGYIFGAYWASADKYLRVLAFMLFFQISVSPLSSMFYIARRQRLNFLMQIVLLAGMFVGVFTCWYLYRDPISCLVTYVILYTIKYIVEYYFAYRFSCQNEAVYLIGEKPL